MKIKTIGKKKSKKLEYGITFLVIAYLVSVRKHSNIKYVSFCALAIYF
jgi:hypothetical protein